MANDRMRPRKRKKVCSFCVDKVEHIDYKDTAKLRRYLSERGKILPQILWILLVLFSFRLSDYHTLWSDFPFSSANLPGTRYSPNPNGIATTGLASSAFARHYSQNLV